MIVPKRANMTANRHGFGSLLMAWFTAAIWIESRRGTENIYAVLHQRSISIQHEHMCEVLGAQQVFVKHPQPTIHSKQSWLALIGPFLDVHVPQKKQKGLPWTAIKQRISGSKGSNAFPNWNSPFRCFWYRSLANSARKRQLWMSASWRWHISHNKTAKPKRQERRTCIFHHPLPGTYKQVSSHPSCHIPYVAIWSAGGCVGCQRKITQWPCIPELWVTQNKTCNAHRNQIG